MATRKENLTQAVSLTDEVIWLAGAVTAEIGLLIAHDGKQLPPTGAAHFAAEVADGLLTEFKRRYRHER